MRRWQTGVTFAYEWRACRAALLVVILVVTLVRRDRIRRRDETPEDRLRRDKLDLERSRAWLRKNRAAPRGIVGPGRWAARGAAGSGIWAADGAAGLGIFAAGVANGGDGSDGGGGGDGGGGLWRRRRQGLWGWRRQGRLWGRRGLRRGRLRGRRRLTQASSRRSAVWRRRAKNL